MKNFFIKMKKYTKNKKYVNLRTPKKLFIRPFQTTQTLAINYYKHENIKPESEILAQLDFIYKVLLFAPRSLFTIWHPISVTIFLEAGSNLLDPSGTANVCLRPIKVAIFRSVLYIP